MDRKQSVTSHHIVWNVIYFKNNIVLYILKYPNTISKSALSGAYFVLLTILQTFYNSLLFLLLYISFYFTLVTSWHWFFILFSHVRSWINYSLVYFGHWLFIQVNSIIKFILFRVATHEIKTLSHKAIKIQLIKQHFHFCRIVMGSLYNVDLIYITV